MEEFLDEVRSAIRESGIPICHIAKLSGVPKGSIHYWLSHDECNPTLLLMSSVLEVIGYKITIEEI